VQPCIQKLLFTQLGIKSYKITSTARRNTTKNPNVTQQHVQQCQRCERYELNKSVKTNS